MHGSTKVDARSGRLGIEREAIQAYQKAIEIDPELAIEWIDKADALLGLGWDSRINAWGKTRQDYRT